MMVCRIHARCWGPSISRGAQPKMSNWPSLVPVTATPPSAFSKSLLRVSLMVAT